MTDTLIFGAGQKARSIGPGIMGGRVSALAFDPHDPYTYYVGLATGGVVRTNDNGQTFSPVFDKEAVASIGDIALSPSDSSVVYVATGEANDRNSTGWGAGVYRSSDGGGSWTFAGLKDSKSIARIVVHPTDPKTAWAAVAGNLWAESAERGIYKTTDGGANWTKVLSAPKPNDTKAGGGDIAIDPSNPNVLYAALYARIRRPWSFVSGVDYTGADVGGDLRRAPMAAPRGRSSPRGCPRARSASRSPCTRRTPRSYTPRSRPTWAARRTSTGRSASPAACSAPTMRANIGRACRASNPRAVLFLTDPRRSARTTSSIYVLGFMVHVSEDGGKTWREDRFKNVHSDNHALSIDPRNSKHIILGTDGGIYQSFDGAESWQHVRNVPSGEYYRVQVDMSSPYRICGGLQDNENWITPSAVWSKNGITNGAGFNISGGDGAYCAFDATDSNLVYAESQGGTIFRMDLTNGEARDLQPSPSEGSNAFRYHWVSPIVQSVHAPGTLYLAGNRIFKITDHGTKWQAISKDLSTRDYDKMTVVGSGAEDYGVIYAFAESPMKAGLLWAGS